MIADCLRPLTDEELAEVVPVSEKEIHTAMEQAERERAASRVDGSTLPGCYW